MPGRYCGFLKEKSKHGFDSLGWRLLPCELLATAAEFHLHCGRFLSKVLVLVLVLALRRPRDSREDCAWEKVIAAENHWTSCENSWERAKKALIWLHLVQVQKRAQEQRLVLAAGVAPAMVVVVTLLLDAAANGETLLGNNRFLHQWQQGVWFDPTPEDALQQLQLLSP